MIVAITQLKQYLFHNTRLGGFSQPSAVDSSFDQGDNAILLYLCIPPLNAKWVDISVSVSSGGSHKAEAFHILKKEFSVDTVHPSTKVS